MAINSVGSTTGSLTRISGLSGSGIDTDALVKQLMTAERMPLDKLNQQKQLAQWKQDDYRNITNLLRDLKDSYFNVAKPTSNMLSQSNFLKYTGTSSDSSVVTVTGNAASTAGSHTVSVISLATAGKAVSGGGVTDALQGNAVSDYNLSGKKLQITVDGITREITLDNYSYDAGVPSGDIVSKAGTGLQALLDNAFGTYNGSSKVTATFDAATQKLTFNTAAGASKVTLAGGNALTALGFTAGASNRLDVNQSLDTLKNRFANDLTFNGDGKLIFKINSTSFTFDKSTSLSSMMNTINADAGANVNMAYDETSDKFVVTSKQLGYGDNIMIDAATQEGTFFGAGGASGINTGSAITDPNKGSDAVVKIDGQLVTRNSNSFTVNGVTYNLLKANTDPNTQSQTVSLTQNTDDIFNSIKGFVDKYNDIISKINTKLGEKYDRNYLPLSDDQKSQMKDADITAWNDKAKTGLLRNDTLLQDIVYNMRRALSDSVTDANGTKTSLSSIGVTTGNYQDEGKLIIDEDKLRAAIQKDPNAVANLFTKQSSVSYSSATTSDLRNQRYNEEGLAGRISDILDNNIRTTGGKGLLLQKAGLPGDITEYTSMIYNEIDGYNKNITDLTSKLTDKENAYYAKFTAMEQYISKMNSQSSWLSSQFSSSSQ